MVSGSGFDWAKGGAKIPIVFLFELRDLYKYGFLLPPNQIVPNNEEVMDGMGEMHRYVKELGYWQELPSHASTSFTNSVIVLIMSVFALVFN